MAKEKTVFIKVKAKTRKRLLDLGKKGESYDDVITRMFDELDYPNQAEYLKRKEEEERERGLHQ